MTDDPGSPEKTAPPRTPFQAVSHEAPRLSVHTRLESFAGAVILTLSVVLLVIAAWDWCVVWLRAKEAERPYEVWYDPYDGLDVDPSKRQPPP